MMDLIPEELIVDIISRLPAESVLDCRRVSKTWRTLTYHPLFAHLHHNYSFSSSAAASSAKVSFVAVIRVRDRKFQLQYGENDDDDDDCNKKLKNINHPLIHFDSVLVGSCNGLICISTRDRLPCKIYHPKACIFNPITREYINLPRLITQMPRKESYATFGFGYHPKTNEYKVVCIYYNSCRQSSVGQLQVYTLASGSGWRNKGEIQYRFSSRPPGLLANGALYWADVNDGKIVSFDLVDEEFRLITSLPCVNDIYQLRVLRGLLCAIHHEWDSEFVTVWSLKKNNNSSYNLTKEEEEEEENQTWSWSLELRMEWEGVCRIDFTLNHDAFALTNSGEVLFWDDVKCLCRYSPETKFVERLVNYAPIFTVRGAVPHINSFISLKALGEDAKMIETA